MQPSSSASGDLLRFCFRQRESGSSRFLPLQQDETGGSPERVAVRGTQLHVFFADGTHLRLAPVPPDVVQPRSNTFWELKLPDSSVPLAVAGDSVSGVLYAVVPGRVAALLTDEPPDEPDTKNEEPTSAPSVDDASAPDEIQAASEGNQEEASSCWLVRYARGRWWRTCSIPGLADEPGACLLAAEDGVVDLYFSDPGDDLTVYSTQLEGDAWSPVGRVGEVAWSQVAACGITAGQAVLILRHNATLTAVTREPNGWVETDPIPPPADGDGGWSSDPDQLDAALAGSAIVVAWLDESGAPHAGLWTLAGAVADEPTTIKALTNPADSPIDLQILDAVPFILLTAAMIFVIARRRQNIAEEVILPDGLAPAAHGRRVTGFLLDAVITAPATYAIMAAWFRHIGPDSDLEGNVGTALALHSWELYWRWLTALAVYIAYHILFEGLRGATPGKMIVGCRVVNERGQRCSLGAIVVRNVLRVVEFFPRFAVAPILVLVILTRNRQRLGDLAARTVVVERRDPNGTTANPPRSSEPGNP